MNNFGLNNSLHYQLSNLISNPTELFFCRSAEFVALLAVSSTLFLFLHTQSLTSRLREMEVKLQPSEMSASGLTGNSIIQGTSYIICKANATCVSLVKVCICTLRAPDDDDDLHASLGLLVLVCRTARFKIFH